MASLNGRLTDLLNLYYRQEVSRQSEIRLEIAQRLFDLANESGLTDIAPRQGRLLDQPQFRIEKWLAMADGVIQDTSKRLRVARREEPGNGG